MKYRVWMMTLLCVALCSGMAMGTAWAGASETWPACYAPFAKSGQLDLYYQFDVAQPGLVSNLASPGRGDLAYVSRSAYGPWRGAEVQVNDHRIMPQMTLGRDGFLTALQTGTTEYELSPTGWLPDFEAGYTLSFWMRVRDVAESFNGTVMHLNTGYKIGWRLEFVKAKWAKQGRLALACGNGKNTTTLECKPFLPERWHHVAIVAANGNMHLYVNGQLADQSKQQLNMPKPDSQEQWFCQTKPERGLRIFSKWYSKANLLDYRIDELAALHTPINAAQVKTIYEAGKPQDIGEENKTQRLLRLEAENKRRENLASLQMHIDAKSFGYFPVDQPIVLTFSAKDSDIQPAEAYYTLKDASGNIIFDTKIAFASQKTQSLQTQIALPQPGLYLLTMAMLDGQGARLNARQYPLAATPVINSSTQNSDLLPWLGAQNLSQRPEAAALNVGLTRVVCDWRDLEPVSGEYDWSSSDQSLLPLRTSSIQTIVCVSGFPRWANVKPKTTIDDKTLEQYQQFIRKMLARYRHIQYWEIWDASQWIPSSQLTISQYRQLLAAAAPVIRAAKGQKQIVSGSVWQLSAHWTQTLLQDKGGDLIDILCVQSHIADPTTQGKLFDQLQSVQAVCRKMGYPNLPIWNTGLGIQQANRSALFPDASQRITERSWPIPLANEHDAATWMIQSMVMQLASGVQRVILDPSPAAFYPMQNAVDGSPGLKGLALSMLTQTLGFKPQLMPIESAPSGLHLYALTTGNHQAGLIAFAKDKPMMLVVKAVDDQQPVMARDMFGRRLTLDQGKTIQVGSQPVYLLNATRK
ncbi:MAG: LamG-like jellyroll fold domain-containing protein [Phycisphaeraceae bacterium JB051]